MDSFYDIKGNEISAQGIVAEFINNYNGKLTDFNEGSEIRNLLEAFAVYAMGLEERLNDSVYVMDIMNADGEYLDLLAGQPGIDMERNEGEEATGEVLFTMQHVLSEELLIPSGTVVSADNGMDFETQTDNKIMPGDLSTTCMVEAIEVGTDGNISANSILTKIDGYDAVQGFTVSNPEPFRGGVDYEEDEEFRERIIAEMSLQKFGSKPYYISKLMNEFPEAHDILFDTSSENYTAVVTPNTYNGTEEQAQLERDVMDYLSNENNVGIKHSFAVVPPMELLVPVYIQEETPSDRRYFQITGLSDYSTETVDKVKELLKVCFYGGRVSFGTWESNGLNLGEEFDLNVFARAFYDLFGYDASYVTYNDPFHFSTAMGYNKYNVVFY